MLRLGNNYPRCQGITLHRTISTTALTKVTQFFWRKGAVLAQVLGDPWALCPPQSLSWPWWILHRSVLDRSLLMCLNCSFYFKHSPKQILTLTSELQLFLSVQEVSCFMTATLCVFRYHKTRIQDNFHPSELLFISLQCEIVNTIFLQPFPGTWCSGKNRKTISIKLSEPEADLTASHSHLK